MSRVEKVMDAVKSQLNDRILVAGSKLPSIRHMASNQSVSISTVVTAYDRLNAEGLIISRPGSGYYVQSNQAALPKSIQDPIAIEREINPLWVARQALEMEAYSLKPGCGWLPSDWLPEQAIRRAMRAVSKHDITALTEYAPPLGDEHLRQLLAQRLVKRNIAVSPSQIMVTDSGTQAIDLICRLFIQEGDAVIVDDPCYFNFHALLKAQRAKVIAIPLETSGPDLNKFEDALNTHKPRLYITNSCLQNPTGLSISPVIAHKLLGLCERYGVTIIEDDIFGDLDPMDSPLLASFDGLDNVIHISSFSKTVSASIRCGYIACRPNWIEDLIALKIASSFTTSRLGGEIMTSLLIDGSYYKSVDGLKKHLTRAMSYSLRNLEKINITPWHIPKGGMFLWCKLPEGISAKSLSQKALSQDILLAPGPVFSLQSNADQFMRFNVAQCQAPEIYGKIQALIHNTLK